MAVKVFPTVNDIGGGKIISEANFATLIKALLAKNFVVSGFTAPASSANLILPIDPGEAFISGYDVSIDATTNVTCTASATNHIFLKLTRDASQNVTGAVFEVNTTGTAPADSVKVRTAVAGASSITSTADARSPRAGIFFFTDAAFPPPTFELSYTSASPSPGTWFTVGPTGSGATQIWTALDSVPIEAKAIRFYGHTQSVHGSGAAGDAAISALFRKPGSTVSLTAWATFAAADLPNERDFNTFFTEVQINSNRVFEMYVNSAPAVSTTTTTIRLNLAGWYI